MGDKYFVWLAPTGEASTNGRRLEQGRAYAVADFPPEIVEEWVRSGAAKYQTAGKKKPAEEE